MGRGFEPAVNGGAIEEAIRLVGISGGGSERGVSVREVTLILNDSHGFSSAFHGFLVDCLYQCSGWF